MNENEQAAKDADFLHGHREHHGYGWQFGIFQHLDGYRVQFIEHYDKTNDYNQRPIVDIYCPTFAIAQYVGKSLMNARYVMHWHEDSDNWCDGSPDWCERGPVPEHELVPEFRALETDGRKMLPT